MENLQNISQIRAALMNDVRILQELSNQAFHIESHIKKIINSLNNLEKGNIPDISDKKNNIIPFPCHFTGTKEANEHKTSNNFYKYPFLMNYQRKNPLDTPINGRIGELLPSFIPDFRNDLQRDGLILLSWDKRINENGEKFTAYWVTSTGIYRYFASAQLDIKDFPEALPNHKSYAAEDGIDFFGQPKPHYIVHIIPELMMGNRGIIDIRPEYIKILKETGIKIDFDFKYLLTKEKKKFPERRKGSRNFEGTGA